MASRSETPLEGSEMPKVTEAEEVVILVAPKRNKKLTSSVWNDFERNAAKTLATCKHCKKKLSAQSTSGTSHLRNHLKRCLQQRVEDKTQPVLNVQMKSGVVKVETFKFDEERSRRDLSTMLVYHGLPFAFADYVGFKRFIGNLQPLFTLICSKTVASDCMVLYGEEKKKMYEKIQFVQGRITITSDMWTSCQNFGYMSLTAHYIDKDWKLQKRLLNFLKVDVPHNAEKLAETLLLLLMEWNIDRNLFAVVLDNCSTNDCVVDIICARLLERGYLLSEGMLFHIRCAAHILNIIVQDGLESIEKSLAKIRITVRIIRKSQAKNKIFREAVKQCNIKCERKLPRDCPTRWNSTFKMLEVVLIYQKAFTRYHERTQEQRNVISEGEWDRIRALASCLQVFYRSTMLFSGTKYPTSNIFFAEICEVNLAIKEWMGSRNGSVRAMATSMKPKFDKYWSICHSALAVAAILDPTKKMDLVTYLFGEIYEANLAKIKVDAIETAFRKLYHEYELRSPLHSPPLTETKNVTETENVLDSSEGGNSFVNEGMRKRARGFDEYVKKSKKQAAKNDIDCYLEESVLPSSRGFDILDWWKVNEGKYPILSQMARDVLGIPVSTVASESAFSIGGRILNKSRSCLHEDTVQALLCTQDWLKDEFKALGSDRPSTTDLASSLSAFEDMFAGGDRDAE